MDLLWLAPFSAFVALVFAGYLAWQILKASPGDKKMQNISDAIRKGAKAYLYQQYKIIAIFFAVVFIVLLALSFIGVVSGFAPYAFLTGGFFSGLAGYVGMHMATKANCRTAEAARKSLNASLRVAFSSGSVMGLSTVGMMMVQDAHFIIIIVGHAAVQCFQYGEKRVMVHLDDKERGIGVGENEGIPDRKAAVPFKRDVHFKNRA